MRRRSGLLLVVNSGEAAALTKEKKRLPSVAAAPLFTRRQSLPPAFGPVCSLHRTPFSGPFGHAPNPLRDALPPSKKGGRWHWGVRRQSLIGAIPPSSSRGWLFASACGGPPRKKECSGTALRSLHLIPDR